MKKWVFIVILLVLLYLVSLVVAFFAFNNNSKSFGDKIMIVPLEGAITTSGNGDLFGGSSGISSTEVVKLINDLNKDESVKGVVFEINSPGGTVVASQEIGDAIKKLNKTNYAVIREVGASGGYWIASATDKIYSSPMSITGSIGVLGSYLEFSGLFEKYGVDYEQLVSGKYKDTGTPFKDLDEDERRLLQSKINLIHEYFVKEVANNRGLTVEEVSKLATGEFYLGQEAVGLGLVDEFGDVDVAVENMKTELNLTKVDVQRHFKDIGLLDILGGRIFYAMGRGVGDSLVSYELSNNFEIRA